MPESKQLPVGTEHKLAVWSDGSGTPYLVRKQSDGSTTFTPLETALAQQQTLSEPVNCARVTTSRDPLATVLIGFAAVLGLILAGYGIGFLAGANGQRVVIVPVVPACNTRSSSFMFWSSQTKECN